MNQSKVFSNEMLTPLFLSRLITISTRDNLLLINDRPPIEFSDIVSVRMRAWTAHKENIFKKTHHGRVTIEWVGPFEGLQVVEFLERDGARKAEKLCKALVEVTGFQGQTVA